MRIRPAACAALLVAAFVPVLAAPPASAAAAKYADDFNGDGYRDYATYSPGHSPGSGVVVTFGTATGPGTRTQVIDQSSPGVPGADEDGDLFGGVMAPGDFNADGYADLAVTAYGEDIDGRTEQGSVTILWGGAGGLSGGTAVPNMGAKRSDGHFGRDLAVGDFDGDGKKDLAAISAGKTYVYRGPITPPGVAGAVSTLDRSSASLDARSLVAGNVNGDGSTDLVVVGLANAPEFGTDAWFVKGGATLTSGKTLRLVNGYGDGAEGAGVIADFNKDGYGDLAVGSMMYGNYQGRVSLWYGSATGPAASARITQATTGVAGTPETGDSFGSSLSAADVDGDGYRDLAVGVFGEQISAKTTEGGVHVLRGGPNGVTGAGSQWFARNTPGVPGSVAWNDCFGSTVRLRDTDRDGHADLYVTGIVDGSLRLPGTASGITTTGVSSADTDVIEGMLQ
ncbi:FG-GAP-like repeat-containing protein [Streptomyces sp. NPDC058989]|uniref:FG-GAP-like repeat-containing protein n=1 Tax=Streptomyces sp. NPDC058989 TaxID=3346686 RepID=UPI0036BF3722